MTVVADNRRLGRALTVIAAAQLMLVLDGTITNVALPSIQRDLRLATADLNWVITAYALAFGGLLLAGGRAGDLFGRRRVFRAGLVIFTVASLLGGLAPNGTVLIAARALQGVGAAIAAPTALSLLATTFPDGPARNRALGVYGAMGGLGSVAGLLLGGALTEYLDWRWVLFVNVPIAVAVLAGTTVLPAGTRDCGRLDLPGATTATAGLALLTFAINRAGTHGWADTTVLLTGAVAVALIAGFARLQAGSPVAMLPPRVLRDRNRAAAYVIVFLTGAGMFATFYFLTLYLQVVRGNAAMLTGLAYLPFAFGMIVAAGFAGPRLLARLPVRTVTAGGLVLAVAGMAWFSLVTPTSSYWGLLAPAMVVTSLGLGLAFVTTTVIGVSGVADRDTGVAAGLVSTMQQVGGAVGLAVLTAVAAAATAGHTADALTSGYARGFLVGGLLYAGALVGALSLRRTVGAGQATRSG